MPETTFAVRAEQTLENLLEAMSNVDELADLDVDIIGGVLTVEFDDGDKIIINQQAPVEQIWLASPEGAAHYNYNNDTGNWEDDKTGETLTATLNRVLGNKTGALISL